MHRYIIHRLLIPAWGYSQGWDGTFQDGYAVISDHLLDETKLYFCWHWGLNPSSYILWLSDLLLSYVPNLYPVAQTLRSAQSCMGCHRTISDRQSSSLPVCQFFIICSSSPHHLRTTDCLPSSTILPFPEHIWTMKCSAFWMYSKMYLKSIHIAVWINSSLIIREL